MKRQISQFDTGRLTVAVATPTCSSCCCCCCCLTTAVASSSILTKRIATETKANNISNRKSLLAISALFVPISVAVGYFGFWLINIVASTCTTKTYESYGSGPANTYEICTNPAANFALPIVIISPFVVLTYLYTRAKIPHPKRRAILAMIVIAVGFAIEFFAGAAMILGSAGILYLISIPFLWGLAHKIYSSTPLSKPIKK